MNNLSRYQDVFGQLAFLKSYTQLCIGFSTVDASATEDALTSAIQKAAAKLTEAFPWLAGQVFKVEESCPSNSGPFKIVPYEKHVVNPPVVVTKLPNIDYEEIVRKKAPFSMLDGDILAPRKGLPSSYGKEEEPAPVFIIQANFVKNGLILTFAAQHNIMDMNGQGHLITLFAKALRGEPFTQTELTEGNRDRRNLIPLLGPDEPLQDLSMFIVNDDTPHPEPQQATWTYFRFSRAKLDELKAKALASITNANPSLRPSTNDVLTAFVWKAISTARLARLSYKDRTILSRACNARRALDPPLSPAYMGHCVACTYNLMPIKQLTESSLGDLALSLRQSLNAVDDSLIRSLVTLISRTSDKASISYSAKLDLGRDLMVSSWAEQKTASLDYGLLGTPDFVRRHRFAPMEGVMYLMPRTREGDIDAAICLRDDDFEGLRDGKDWGYFAEYIG